MNYCHTFKNAGNRDASSSFSLLALFFTGLVLASTAEAQAASGVTAELVEKLDALAFDPDDHVVLRWDLNRASVCSGELGAYVRVSPDGSAGSEFSVPEGYTVILQDVSWLAIPDEPTDGFPPGRSLILQLFTRSTEDGALSHVFSSAPIGITTENEGTRLGGAEALSVGIGVGSSRVLCPTVIAAPSFLGASLHGLLDSFVRGTLVETTN